jgi:hypothetical protein
METQKMCEPKDFKHFIGAIGNLYVRANLSTPFDLAKYAKAWPDDGITPSHCIEQARLYLNRYAQYYRLGSGDSSLPILDRIIRKTWLELQYPQADGGSCDEKSRSESQASPVIEGNPEGPVKQWWEPKAPLRRASAQSAEDYAIAFLYRELAEGELSVRELKKRAAAAKIADRTLDRARKKVGVEPRQTGFGKAARHWVSLPKPRIED